VGPGATVGTLRTEYPRVQASSQDNGSRPPAEGSSEAAMCPRGSGSRSRLEAALGPPRAPAAQASSGAATCYLDPNTHLLAQGSSRAATCHLGSAGCKQMNKYPLRGPAIMISIGTGAPISSKALCDKGCSARSQGVRRAAH
jgi:hypothetical protein